jgi:hypothetical protein
MTGLAVRVGRNVEDLSEGVFEGLSWLENGAPAQLFSSTC